MRRNQGSHDLTNLQKGGVLALRANINLFNRRIAKSQKCDKKLVRNMRRAASQAEKENRDPIDPLVHKKKSRTRRPRILNDRDT